MFGFKDTGTLPPCRVGVSHKKPKDAKLNFKDLAQNRVAFNDVLYFAVKPSEFSQDLMECAIEDSAGGYLTMPRKVADPDLSDAHVSRRIAVREWRETLDDFTHILLVLTSFRCGKKIYVRPSRDVQPSINTSTWRGSSGYIKANYGQPDTQECRSALHLRCTLFTASAPF